jgi:hypothetical protein
VHSIARGTRRADAPSLTGTRWVDAPVPRTTDDGRRSWCTAFLHRIEGADDGPAPRDHGGIILNCGDALPHLDGLACVGVGDGQPSLGSGFMQGGQAGGGFPRDG